MKPEEALGLLDQAVSQMNGTRQVHVQLQQAVECLKVVLADLKQTITDGKDV